jgi:hypothetical protein
MGKNYAEELSAISSTVAWASQYDLTQWLPAISKIRTRDLVIVASGGSVSAAQLLAQLHTARTGRLALAMTPLEFASTEGLTDSAVWLVSAGGGNTDILNAWNSARDRGTQNLAILCGAPNSLLARSASEACVPSFVFELPAGRDGFLATTSLAAFCVLILRLYGEELITAGSEAKQTTAAAVLERDTLIVLYGGWLKPVALDMESRFTEAALGTVSLADYRNFAHGRHHWLAKRGANSAVLALITPDFEELAEATLALLPPEVVIERWRFSKDMPGVVLPALEASMILAGAAAQRLGYDAGRPGVPEFGHHIYDLKTTMAPRSRPSAQVLAVRRKLETIGTPKAETTALYQTTLARFQKSLEGVTFAGVVLDYDGTLVATARRYKPIETPVVSALNRLLDEGMLIAVATGRGKSVHEPLRAAIEPAHWPKTIIGYYNGGSIRTLQDICSDVANGEIAADLIRAEVLLKAAPELEQAVFDPRPKQLTITCHGFAEHGLWLTVRGILDANRLNSLKVTHSSHSVDVVPSSVSKTDVVHEVARLAGTSESAILKIGDRGQWPGNDSELLAMSHGLSVDQISSSLESCWNLAPSGCFGPDATLFYLQCLQNGRFRIS